MPSAGTTTARGYGYDHQLERARWAPKVKAGGVCCWRCRLPISPRSAWHLGHDDRDRTLWRGPEHARCNTSAAARKGNRARGRARRPRIPRPRLLLVVDDW